MPLRHLVRKPTVLVALLGLIASSLFAFNALGAGAFTTSKVGPLPAFPAYRPITFPVVEPVYYSDTFGACRGTNCSRTHMGEDLIGQRLFHELAAHDGTVTFMRNDAAGTGGNWLVITDSQGWTYQYGHINNDTPGTDDGANPPQWRFAPGLHVGQVVKAGQFVAYMGDSGDAEWSVPHLHFEIRTPAHVAINEWPSLRLAQNLPIDTTWCHAPSNPASAPGAANPAVGYWLVEANGAVHAFGAASDLGDASGLNLWAPVLDLASTPSGRGYWLIASDGGVFSYGTASFHGSTGGMKLDAPIIGMVATPSGYGYWLFASDGGIFTFGDAPFYGSAAGKLDPGTVATAVAITKSGQGYWIAASNGKVLPFGNAPHISPANVPRTRTESITRTPSGLGYWLGSTGGGVVGAGDAAYYGMPAATGLCSSSVVGIVSSPDGKGYLTALPDGAVVSFGNARWYGDKRGTAHVVGMTAKPIPGN
jgi:hypothetical protein